MSSLLYFSQFIAIGQKTKASHSRFGEGHNFTVEVGVELQGAGDEAALNAAIDGVLKRIDHKALGVDLDLGVEPETTMLAKWIFDRIQESGISHVMEVRLLRGDGLTASYFVQPSDGKSIEPPDFVKG